MGYFLNVFSATALLVRLYSHLLLMNKLVFPQLLFVTFLLDQHLVSEPCIGLLDSCEVVAVCRSVKCQDVDRSKLCATINSKV